MTLLRGRAADRTWQLLPGAAAAAAVESSFEHALNLRVPAGLLTLLTRHGRPAPGALITDATALPRLAAGTPVSPRSGGIRVGALDVDLLDCAFYSCRVDPLTGSAPRPADAAARARRALDAVGTAGSFRSGADASPFELALGRRLTEAGCRFREALRAALQGEQDRLETATAGLIGLGCGLTPSGDDYLVGALAVLTLHPATAAVRDLLADAVTVNAGATTTVGGHYLRAAADRCFHHDVTRAAGAAITGSGDLVAAFAAVAAIGSTSGTDTLTGVVDTLDVLTPPPL